MKTASSRALISIGACIFGISIVATYPGPSRLQAATTEKSVNIACKTATPCARVQNRGSGIAIDGRSDNNSAIQGSSFAPNPPITTVNGFALGLSGGLVGNDYSSTSNLTNSNSGVAGFSQNAIGVLGVTANACYCGSGTDVNTFVATPAIFGFDAGPLTGLTGSGNVGVAGRSLSRVGGLFLSRTGYGAVGRTFTGTGVLAVSRAAGGVALAATSLQGGPLFRGFSATHEVASLDSNGNLVIAGSIRTGEVPQFATKSASGTSVVTYGARQSIATVEDFGRAQILSGSAEVRLDPAFVALTDRHTDYMVFVTAEGENRGLYVTNKTPLGFSVRESQGGRNTLALTYRIVARPFGAHDARFNVAPSPTTVSISAVAPSRSQTIRAGE